MSEMCETCRFFTVQENKILMLAIGGQGYWQLVDKIVNTCRKNAPTDKGFPPVRLNDGCGDHEKASRGIEAAKSVFVIGKFWHDGLENSAVSAEGYKTIGYLEDEKAAKQFCSKGGVIKKEVLWCLFNDRPEYEYTEIKLIEGE